MTKQKALPLGSLLGVVPLLLAGPAWAGENLKLESTSVHPHINFSVLFKQALYNGDPP